ncbi:MAG: hypothetical protein JW818_19315 [Pirellulales bacterium]|nr:hypothetical protein [Pirellulales bacterium]
MLEPYASKWLDPDFCYITDTTLHGGAYIGEPRPFVGSVDSFLRTEVGSLHSIPEIDAIELAVQRALTHSIVLAAMCNDLVDHQILCEVVSALAQQHDGVVDFDSISGPLAELDMTKCAWSEDGTEYWTVLGSYRSGRMWLKHPRFHMVK